MDNAAKWFLAGIFISLVNTALVLFFIGIPGINDNDAEVRVVEVEVPAAANVTVAEAPPSAVTFVLVQDEDGNVIVERTELAEVAARKIAAANSLGLAAPQFAEVTRPAFVAARSGVAWVTVRSRLELWRVDLEGRVEGEGLDGIENLGESTVVDVDVAGDGALHLLIADATFDWRLFRRPAGGVWTLLASSALSSWPAEVVAVTVADNGAVYLAARQPSGLFRLAPPFQQVSDWVPGSSFRASTPPPTTHCRCTPRRRARRRLHPNRSASIAGSDSASGKPSTPPAIPSQRVIRPTPPCRSSRGMSRSWTVKPRWSWTL